VEKISKINTLDKETVLDDRTIKARNRTMLLKGAAKILVVDDEEAIRTLIAGAFSHDENIEVHTAGSRSEGLACTAKYRYDVVIVDKQLPDGSGLDIINALQEYSEHSQAIVITAYSDTDSAIQAVSLGVFRYILKPFDIKMLRADIFHALEATTLKQNLARQTAELKEMNRILAKQEARYRILFNSSIDAIWVFPLNEKNKPAAFIEVNDRACELFGYSRAELLDMAIGDLIDSNESLEYISEIHEAAENRHLLFEIDAKTRDGRKIPLEISSRLLKFDNARTVFSIVRDITERRANEQERAALEIQVREAQKMEAIGRLAGGVAHDMNNVLGAVMGFASALEAETSPSGKWYQDVSGILKACRKGRDLTRDLLGFARKGKYVLENVSFNELVEDVVNILTRIAPKKVEFFTDLEKDLAPVEGDFGQLNHALMNVCLNAVDAVETSGNRGCIFIRTRTETIDTDHISEFKDIVPGKYATIEVCDNGIGMDPQTLERSLEPFFTTKPQGKGTGLGLAMVYGTVKNHAGAVRLISEIGKGTTVRMCFPISRNISVKGITKSNHSQTIMTRIGTVLLVDDEAMVRNSGKRLLERLGYRVILARNGEEAIEIFKQQRDAIRLVVLDLIMPIMDGEETFLQLRQIDPAIRVLLSSGYTKEEKADDLMGLGAVGFLQKPFDLKTLVQELDKLQPQVSGSIEKLTVA
jgi:two-component system, cell cycle sensor histidine kinase and response regulator CckA